MKNLEWIKTKLIAHRGLHTGNSITPENSMKAFRLAIDKNYGIECDVNVLKDGTVVVFHDKDLKRMCGDNRCLQDLTIEEIKQVHLLDSNERIPTLQEFLDLVDSRVPLLIELKPNGSYKVLCEAFMKVMDRYQGEWAMHSFHPGSVNWFRINRPEVIRGQISEYFLQDNKMNKLLRFCMKHLLFNIVTHPDFVNYGIHNLPNKYVDRAQRRGIVIIAYAAHNQEQFDMCKQHYSNSVFEFFEPKH
ncbi:MAG: glycerophosphodiester phosphodiesterase family protein [Candidatus Izemoplasmatales bacterium]|jgi:glycerophosphoryl diester phosphodiesterase